MASPPKSSADRYDKEYYDHYLGPLPYDRNQPVWRDHFQTMAKTIVERFRPARVMDIGCAKGFLVEQLRDLGVEGYGRDISPYAISEVRPDIRPYCTVASVTEPLQERYDLITCIEVAEHVTEEEGRRMIENICQHTDEVIFSSTPSDFSEATHINVQPRCYWQAMFAAHGFYPDLHFDPHFVTPHAINFRRMKNTELNVAVFSREPANYAVVLLRLAGPIQALEARGRMKLHYFTLSEEHADTDGILGSDLFVIHREFADQRLSSSIVKAARMLGKPIVFEIDDLLINVPRSNPNWSYCQAISADLLAMVREADFITVTTESLREELQRTEPASKGKIHVLPNCIDLSIWGGETPARPRDQGPFVIGWFGTATHDDDLAIVKPAITYLLRKYRGQVVFKFWGYLPPELANLEGVVLVRGPQPDVRRHAQGVRMSQIDLAIAPLADHPFNHSKSNLKWLEYSICRIPGIYSNITPYFSSIAHGYTGWLVDNSTEAWVEAIERLINEDCLREELASNAYREVWNKYRLDLRAERWDAIYRTFVVSGPNSNRSLEVSSARKYSYDCSIIIPVFNKVELTRQCLTHLAQVTQNLTYEVIIVDNGSTDDTPSFLASLGGDIRIIRNSENLGFAKACNQGAQVARGRHLVFLNNDTIPQLGWLEALVDEVTSSPDVGIVGSKLLYPNETIQHAGVVFSRAYSLPYHVYRGFPSDVPAVNRRREFQAVTAACILIRRAMFEAVGGFDEGYHNGFEDIDLCLKIRDRGGRIIYQPKSVLYHLEEQTPGRKDHDTENGRRLLGIWGNRWLVDEDTIYVPDGYAIRARQEDNGMHYCIGILANTEEKVGWERVAEVERQGQAGNMEAVHYMLGQPDFWPHDPGVLRWAAQLCDRTGVPTCAEPFWRRALTFGGTPDVLVALTRIALEKGALDEAEQHVHELITQAPTHGEGWLLQGILALQQQGFAKAEAAFENALRNGSHARKARMGLGMAAMGLGQVEKAWDSFAAVLANDVDDAEAIHCLLRAGTALERWQPLADSLYNYLKLNPGDLSVRFALAGVQIRLGDWEAAHGNYEMIRLLEPTFAGLDDLAQILKTGNIGADV